MKTTVLTILICIVALMSSCSDSSDTLNTDIEYIPFQEERDGYWGMIAPDGEVLFSAEFKEKPTVAVNGRFIVKNADGLYEYYTAEKKPRKIGSEYIAATLFNDDVTPVVRKDHSVELIDKDGNVVSTLDEADGRRILTVSNFSDGLAVFTTSDGAGCIDTRGNVVIKPVYAYIDRCNEGRMIAMQTKYRGKNKDEQKLCVIDKKGNITAEFAIRNIEDRAECFIGGLLPVAVRDDEGRTEAGLVDVNGEWVLKPTSKIRDIRAVNNDHIIYSDGNGFGVKNIDGETVIRAKYRSLDFAYDNMLMFENEKGEYGFIDLDENKLIDETFDKAYGMFKGKYIITATGRNNWEIIDKEGNSLSRKTDIYDISFGLGSWTVRSDFFSYDAMFGEIGITADTFGKLGIGMKAGDIAALCSEGKAVDELAGEYAGRSSAYYSANVLGCSVTISAIFNGNMVDLSTGSPAFASVSPVMLSIMMPSSGKISGKVDETFNAVKAYVAKLGKPLKEDANNAVYNLKGDRCILVTKNGTTVALFLGDKTVLGVAEMPKQQSEETSETGYHEFQPDNSPANGSAETATASAPVSQLLSTRKLTYSDISSLSKSQLRILRNEIYARHGYIFKSADLKAYFGRYEWYKPRYSDVTSMMSAIEKYNAQFIKKYE